MAFRYERNGVEHLAQDVHELERALRAGEIEKSTLVLDETIGRRLPAGPIIAMNRKAPLPSAAPAQAPPFPPAITPSPSPKSMAKAKAEAGEEPGDSNPRRVRIHRVIASLLAIATMFVVTAMDIPPYIVGEHTGRALVILLVVVVLSGWIFGRKTDRQKIRLAWIGSITWIVVMLVPAYFVKQVRDERIAADRVAAKKIVEGTRKAAAEMEALIKDDGKTPPPVAAAAPAAPATVEAPGPGSQYSLMARIAPVAASTQEASLKEVREWKAFENSLGLETALTPATLSSPEGRKRNREMFARYITEFDAHLARLDAILAGHRAKLMELVKDDPARVEFTRGVDQSVARTRETYEEMRRNQKASIEQMNLLNDFMSARGGTIVLERDKLVFATQRDVDTYNQYIERIVALAKEEEAITSRQLERVRGAADRIEKLAPK